VARGPLGLSELATQQAINRTMLSRVLGKLEAADLIVRRPTIADGRAIEVMATPEGARLRERLIAARTRLLAEKLAGLPGETITTIIDAVPGLAELAAALEPTP
jgi:DNA-binding MarR family transcriptional regulator